MRRYLAAGFAIGDDTGSGRVALERGFPRDGFIGFGSIEIVHGVLRNGGHGGAFARADRQARHRCSRPFLPLPARNYTFRIVTNNTY